LHLRSGFFHHLLEALRLAVVIYFERYELVSLRAFVQWKVFFGPRDVKVGVDVTMVMFGAEAPGPCDLLSIAMNSVRCSGKGMLCYEIVMRKSWR
jgi:hypothetical protein